jgi:uncharacterized RDD family membrane protein YckC
MYCSKCGANIPEGVAFCPACGQPTGSVATTVQPTAAASPAFTSPPPVPTWQAPVVAPTVGYAGFWLRFVALIIDGIILLFARRLLFLPFGLQTGMSMAGIFRRRQPQDFSQLVPMIGLAFRIFVITAVMTWLYSSLMESSTWQATLGKKALGLTVTDLEGRRISFGRATGRYFAKYVSKITLGIGYIMAGFTAKKQALHDMIAGTLVLRKL